MAEISKIVGLMVLSAFKFVFAPSTTVYAGYNFLETILITSSGGILGFLLFYRFGAIIKKGLQKVFKPKPKPVFSKKNRLLARIKKQYGLIGLAVLTPCLLSVPLGAILASIYYSEERRTIPLFLAVIVMWSILLTGISISFKSI